MNYEAVDPIFYAWALKNKLQVYTDCKDVEVRMVRLFGHGKEFADIGIELVQADQIIVIFGIARRPSRNSQHDRLNANLHNLPSVLDQAYSKVIEWLNAR